jgi:hypothetical protein
MALTSPVVHMLTAVFVTLHYVKSKDRRDQKQNGKLHRRDSGYKVMTKALFQFMLNECMLNPVRVFALTYTGAPLPDIGCTSNSFGP